MEEKKARRKFSQLTRNRKQASERGGKRRREGKRETQSQRRSQGQREQAERTVAGSPSRPPRRGRRRQRPTKSLQPRASAQPPGRRPVASAVTDSPPRPLAAWACTRTPLLAHTQTRRDHTHKRGRCGRSESCREEHASHRHKMEKEEPRGRRRREAREGSLG